MLEVREVPAGDAEFAAMLGEFVVEMSDRYGLDPVGWEGWGDLPDGTAYLLLLDDGETIGAGALMPFTHSVPEARADEGELKRVYLRPAARGRGASKVLMEALYATARERGYRRLHLETGDLQPEAIGLYERLGWRRTPRYGPWADNPESVCFELDLA